MFDQAASVPVIKQIVSPQDLETSAQEVRRGFATLARDFGLPRENNPTHTSFIENLHLVELQAKGFHLFGLFEKENQVGFVSLGPLVNGAMSLGKLAVLPEYQYRGCGAGLLRFSLDYASKKEADQIVINLIN